MLEKKMSEQTKLDAYAAATEAKKEAFLAAIRKVGKFAIGPTNRGGIWLKWGDKDICTDVSTKDLREIRDLITDFLVNVAGEGDT